MKTYPNIFCKFGFDDTEIQQRVANLWYELFEGIDKIYFEQGDMGYVEDTGNHDVRTEGMSYAMFLAVQYDKKDVFDRLWKWTKTYMYMETGRHAHYFAWSVSPEGVKNSDGPAPDGEEFFAMALFFANNRWGSGEGIFNYQKEAQELLSYCIHKGQRYEGMPMWNNQNKLIKFIPEVEFSDPSYHVPHFYEQFSLYATKEDQDFWKEAADNSRAYLLKAMHPETGLNAEYADYEGNPMTDTEHYHFFSDSYRTSLNIAVDAIWYEPISELNERLEKLLHFFAVTVKGNENEIYTIEGVSTGEGILHPVGLLATLAAATAAIPDSPHAEYFVSKFWNTPLRTGERRYYDNFLYTFSFLLLSGQYNMFEGVNE